MHNPLERMKCHSHDANFTIDSSTATANEEKEGMMEQSLSTHITY